MDIYTMITEAYMHLERATTPEKIAYWAEFIAELEAEV